jgi:hypothetical protein
LTLRPSKLDGDSAPLGVTGFCQAFAEGAEATAVASRGFGAKVADDRHGLRTGRDHPCRRTTNERDEIAPPHPIGGFDKAAGHDKQGRPSFRPASRNHPITA